jgi:hypothetical protein
MNRMRVPFVVTVAFATVISLSGCSGQSDTTALTCDFVKIDGKKVLVCESPIFNGEYVSVTDATSCDEQKVINRIKYVLCDKWEMIPVE